MLECVRYRVEVRRDDCSTHKCSKKDKNSGGIKIMKPTAKPVKKGKTLGVKKLQKKVPLKEIAPLTHLG
jgi:hypothetical protein